MSYLLAFILSVILMTTSFAATLTTKIDRSTVAIGQSFSLTITILGNDQLGPLNLNSLTKNFTILGTTRNHQVSIINGKISRTNQWIITLAAKKSGQQVIPSVQLGNSRTKPIFIDVTTAQSFQKDNNVPVFIDAFINKKNPYVQSEVLYTVKLYYHVSISNPSITPPTANNAIIKQIGKDQVYQGQYKGQAYNIFQRTYVIFPQSQGKLAIQGPIFRGNVQLSNQPRSIYNAMFTSNNKLIQLVAPTITLKVQAQAAANKSHWWIPARQLTLQQTWSNNPTQIEVGKPITRTITIKAKGLLATQLPNLQFNSMANVNVYPSKAELQNTISNGHVVGIRTEKVVYIPTQQGEINLPAIKVSWWNILANQQQVAQLAGRKIKVIPAVGPSTVQQGAPPPITHDLTLQKPPTTNKHDHRYWKWIMLLFLFAIIGAIHTWWKKHYGKNINSNDSLNKKNISLKELKNNIKTACYHGSPILVKDALLVWAKKKWPNKNIFNLHDLVPLTNNPDMQKSLLALQKQLYSNMKINWSGEKFWTIFYNAKFLAAKKTLITINTDLPGLYLKEEN